MNMMRKLELQTDERYRELASIDTRYKNNIRSIVDQFLLAEEAPQEEDRKRKKRDLAQLISRRVQRQGTSDLNARRTLDDDDVRFLMDSNLRSRGKLFANLQKLQQATARRFLYATRHGSSHPIQPESDPVSKKSHKSGTRKSRQHQRNSKRNMTSHRRKESRDVDGEMEVEDLISIKRKPGRNRVRRFAYGGSGDYEGYGEYYDWGEEEYYDPEEEEEWEDEEDWQQFEHMYMGGEGDEFYDDEYEDEFSWDEFEYERCK